MEPVRLYLDGPGAEAAAAEIEAFVAANFGHRPERARAGAAGGERTRTDLVAAAALVLSIPSAALATMDLTERIKLREKVTALLALARRWREDKGTVVRLETGRGLEDVAALDADRVIEAANAARRGQG